MRKQRFTRGNDGMTRRQGGYFPERLPRDLAAEADEAAVAHFAFAMSLKLAQKREEGRGGWNDPAVCSVDSLTEMLREHVEKGDPVDIANFAMMIWHRLKAGG